MSKFIHCPNCPDQGWYIVQDPKTGELEQVQCQFCYSEQNSVFNNTIDIEEATKDWEEKNWIKD